MTEMLRIQVSTLNEIINAINVSEYVTVGIQLSPLNDKENIIARKTLEKVADEVRAFDGTTGKILIGQLAKRILELSESPDIPDIPVTVKLATPIIALYDDDGIIEPDKPNTEYNTTAILGKAILGFAILGNAIDDGTTLVKLATPVIHLYDDTTGEPDYVLVKLATPVIALYDDSVIEPDAPTVIQLTTPIIALYDETDEPKVTVKQLATSVIHLEEVTEETVEQLATPIIYLEEITEDSGDDEPTEPTIVQLATSVIYLETNVTKLGTPVIYFYEEEEEEPDVPIIPEPTVDQLATPVIYLEVIEDETDEPEVTVKQLDTSAIYLEKIVTVKQLYASVIYLERVEPEATAIQLATPVIELVVEDETEDDGGEVESNIIQLATPVVYLEEQKDPELRKLFASYIYLDVT